ncbi:hypothetical protein N781_14300 [Pontibacillus halophilus JSM 076056 = DSM 19796]|uniref:DUF1643 domain-containing protein n=1 Tax=Pontibacillus halophilus JSM 076056 = DSM 19796 TaxID=1385510 RepID=A0A0A5IB38_9BACI|nr:hypothetical protein [Pontibacillus halophilus]KGX93032.1 hypothetical protein N781_14300 [Pontibacillus halophilus JSM 076056 = DSM 19796]
MFQVYGTYKKKGNHVFRTSAFIQWGTSTQSLGGCLLLNPGSAILEEGIHLKLTRDGEAAGVVRPDLTMRQLVRIVERLHDSLFLEGRFHIYNLFTLQHPKAKDGVNQVEALIASGEYIPEDHFAQLEALREHPFMILGWGVDKWTSSSPLNAIRDQWLEKIDQSNVPTIGIKHENGKDYYHVCPQLNENKLHMIQKLTDQHYFMTK